MEVRLALHEELNGRQHKFITLTLKTTPDEKLAGVIKRLYSAFKDLRRLKLWREAVRGGAAFLEITRGNPKNPTNRSSSVRVGRWHAHLHIVCDASFIPQHLLANAWQACTGDSYIVDIQQAGGKSVESYVSKYVTKALTGSLFNDPDLLDEFVLAIAGTRFCTTFGDWYGKQTLKPLADDWQPNVVTDKGDWRPSTTFTTISLRSFVPNTAAGIAIAALPFSKFLRRRTPGPAP